MNASVLERYHSQDNYYSEGEGLQNSQWRGSFAEFQGLIGTIQKDDWMNACHGKDPDGNANRRQQRGSRSGWDITLSASKSVSLKALIDQDSEILEAHRKTVDATVQYIEEHCIYAQIKRKVQVISEQTQQGHFALFEHDDNRNQEPQLHTHVVILNQTLCSDGKSRTLDSRELFNQKKTIGAIYDHTLAYHLQQQGYALNWTSDHTFEIDGYQKEQLEEFSSRRQEIRDYLKQQNISIEQATEAQKTIACLESRAAKVHKLTAVDHEIQHQAWTKLADELELQHPQPHQNLEDLYQSPSHPGSLNEVIDSALESATAYQVAVSKQQLLRECLRYSQGCYEPGVIAQALEQDERLIQINDQRLTTKKVLKREQLILKVANVGQGTCASLSTLENVEAIAQDRHLNEGQTAGLKHLALNKDQVMLVQSDAGVGKTYTLKGFRDYFPDEAQGQMIGLAPSAAAAQVIQEDVGISSRTVDSYLYQSNQRLERNQLLIVDEAGMLSHQQMSQLLKKTQELNHRLILLGDTKQLSSIGAGAPFRLLQERAQLPTISLNENLRQVTPQLKEAVDLAANQKMIPALQILDESGAIAEIKDEDDRLRAIATKYLERPHERQVQTLVLCDTNRDRQIVTDQIRAAYLNQGKLGQESRKIQTLQPKRLDEQAIAQAYNYEVGDVIRFRSSTPKFPSLYYRVSEVEGDRLKLKDRQGDMAELPIHQYKEREVFRCNELELRKGDRLRFTRNQRDWNQINGQMLTIEGFNDNGTLQINSRGKSYELPSEQMSHADYAYCRTVYGAQGWTAKEAIWAPGNKPGKEQTYVALSRAKETLEVITLDRQALGLSIQQTQAQENALDLVQGQSPKSVQMSLLPGVINESEPKPRRQRREHPIGRSQSEIEQDPVSVEEDRGENRTHSPDGVRAIAPNSGSRIHDDLENLARRFGELESLFDGLGQETEPARRVESESRDWPSFNSRPGDDSVSAPDLGTVDPNDSRIIEPEQRVERPGESLGESTAGDDAIDRSALEPDSAGYSQVDDSTQSDPNVVERETVEPEDLGIRNSRIDISSRLGEYPRGNDDSESVTDANPGANQRTGEQSGNQSEKDAQSVEIEAAQQRLIAIAQDLSDERLIQCEKEMERYFKQAPKRPDYAQVQRYQDQAKALTRDYQRLMVKQRQQQKTVNDLGPVRSLLHPFGSPRQEVEAAELEVTRTNYEVSEVTQNIKTVRRSLQALEEPMKRYEDWSQSQQSHTMHEIQKMLQIPSVQERVAGIHEAQKREKGLKVLQNWEAIAQKLGKSEAYGERIREITEDYRQGVPLSDRAKQALTKDLQAYQRSQKQVQRQSRGFSL